MSTKHLLLFASLTLIQAFGFAQVIAYNTTVKMDGNKKTETVSFKIQINNKNENWLSNVSVQHGAKDRFSLILAQVTNSRGQVVKKVKKKDVLTRSTFSSLAFFVDDLTEEIDLFWGDYPYQIEYSYQITSNEFLDVVHWTPWVFEGVKTISSSLSVETPKNYKININEPDGFDFEKRVDGQNQVLIWKSKDYITPSDELYAPAYWEKVPIIRIMPDEINYGVAGKTENWGTYGKWFEDLNNGLHELTLQEKVTINKILSNATSDYLKVKKLYEHLQDHTTYVLVDVGVGGFQSYPASYVCERKYGDCKALTTYMKALLLEEGIQSNYLLINSGENASEINLSIPSPQFNHVILAVPMETDTIWLENTSNSSPFNYLGTNLQNRYALYVNGENSKIIRTPALSLPDVLEQTTYHVERGSDDDWQVEISSTLKGSIFETLRYYHQNKSKDLPKLIKNYYPIEQMNIEDWDVKNDDRHNSYIGLYVQARCKSELRSIGSYTVLKPFSVELPELSSPEKRTQPVRFNTPINKKNSTVYHLPLVESEEVQLPENFTIDTKYGSYSTTYSLSEDQLVVVKEFRLNAGDWPLEDYNDLFAFIQKIKTQQKLDNVLFK